MKEPTKHMQNYVQLWPSEKEVEQANQRVEEVEAKVMKMEDCLEVAKTKIGAYLEAKDNAIHLELKQQVQRQMVETQQEQEKVVEVRQYVRYLEENSTDQMSKFVHEKVEMHTATNNKRNNSTWKKMTQLKNIASLMPNMMRKDWHYWWQK